MDDRPASVPCSRRVTTIAAIGSILALAGVAVAAYLTYAHYTTPAVLACPDTGIVNCAKVTTSAYSKLAGVPIALAGLVWFLVVAGLQSPWAWRSPLPAVRYGRLGAAAGGVVTVLWLIYAELFRLDAICLYCSVVHGLTLALFVTTVIGHTITADDSYDDTDTD